MKPPVLGGGGRHGGRRGNQNARGPARGHAAPHAHGREGGVCPTVRQVVMVVRAPSRTDKATFFSA